jgi:copper homeostasis protein
MRKRITLGMKNAVVACKIEDTRLLELCCFDFESILLAAEMGVPSIEVCRDYEQGGLWPGEEALKAARRAFPGWLRVMIRPRPGDFRYEDCDTSVLLTQAQIAMDLGADGLTFGVVDSGDGLGTNMVDALLEVVQGRAELTFHRAFDLLQQPEHHLEVLASMGFARVLSSGGQGRAIDHIDRLSHWQQLAGDGLDVVAAGGVRATQLQQWREAGVRAVHSAASQRPDGRADREELQTLLAGWLTSQAKDL